MIEVYDDIDDLDELEALYDEAVNLLEANPDSEQARWYVEDIHDRIEELSSQVEGEYGEMIKQT